MSTRRAIPTSCALLILLSGCGGGSTPSLTRNNAIDYKIISKDGTAELDFGPWLLIFEGATLPIQYAGSSGSINIPFPGGSGASSAIIGPFTIEQKWDAQQNALVINGTAFKLTERGNKLEFADHVFQSTGPRKTILIGKDGKTREAAN